MGIGNLTPSSPLDTADAKYGASELRAIKAEIDASFPNFVPGNDVVTKTAAEINSPATDAGVVAALALKAPLASPTFTGTPAAPTAAADTSTTQLATTAFVTTGLALKAPLASPTFTGTPTTPTVAIGAGSTQLATTAAVKTYTDAADALKANIASPTFTGVPAAPTAAIGTDTTQLATTEYVVNALTAIASYNTLYRLTATMAASATPVEIGATWETTTNATPAYSEVSTDANGRMAVATTGTYRLDATVTVVPTAADAVCVLTARKDSSDFSPRNVSQSAAVPLGTSTGLSLAVFVDLAAGDYVSLWLTNATSYVQVQQAHFSLQRVR